MIKFFKNSELTLGVLNPGTFAELADSDILSKDDENRGHERSANILVPVPKVENKCITSGNDTQRTPEESQQS